MEYYIYETKKYTTMTDMNEIKDTLNIEEHDIKRLPSFLNVLTILTYIGCVFEVLGAIYTYLTVCVSKMLQESLSELKSSASTLDDFLDDAIKMTQKQCENKMVIFLITIVGIALCFYGAMQMRNLKKQGFLIYTTGELLTPILLLAILGTGPMGMLLILKMIVPVIMVILYATQREHLK